MSDYRPEHKTMMDDLLLDIPGVKGGQAFGYPAYKINGRIFAFVGGRGISIKLPKPRVEELIAEGAPQMQPCEVAEGVIWREWLIINHDDPAAYRDDLTLLEEAAAFVAEKA